MRIDFEEELLQLKSAIFWVLWPWASYFIVLSSDYYKVGILMSLFKGYLVDEM